MVGTMIRKAILALFLALLLLIPACSGRSSSSELSSELRARWEQAAYYGLTAEGPEGFNGMKSLESPLIVTSHPNSEYSKEWLERALSSPPSRRNVQALIR